MLKSLQIAASVLIAGLGLAGCGVRGPLEAPPAAKAANEAAATADSGQGKPEGAAAKPHKPFVLDGLIR
jgi:predicted small lipoprotein YifL